jgi:RNA polymerase sigma factor FliA
MMLQDALAPPPLTYARTAPSPDVSDRPETLIKAHSPLVRRIAWHVHSRTSTQIEMADLVQIGMIALVESARSFEDRGIAFGAYAGIRVRGAMVDQLRKEAWICRSGMINRRRLAATRAEMESKLCRRASDIEMAAALELSPSAYAAMAQSAEAVGLESLDESYNDHDPWFADRSDSADRQIEQDQLKAHLAEHIGQLGAREALILQLYFVEELNLEEIGLTLNIGAARVCQIKRVALDKLRLAMADWAPE